MRQIARESECPHCDTHTSALVCLCRRDKPFCSVGTNGKFELENSSSEVDVWQPGKPSQNENEYFARQDAEWLKAQRARLDVERVAKDKVQTTAMKCPRCGGHLEERV